jgi:glutaredoxin-related protein
MKRAKFESLEKQRKFFIDVKKKLRMGSRKLAVKLGLKSRGPLENYSLVRTSPPVEIIKKLEGLSGIKVEYKEVEGKIYRKSRGFIPMNPIEAEANLKKKFGKDFEYLITQIKSDLTIKQIIIKMRERDYLFDNSRMSRYIGAYRTNLLSKIVDKIEPNENEILVNGFVRPGRKTLEINFNLRPLTRILEKNKIRIGLEISEDRKSIRISPLKFGRNLILSRDAIRILITDKSGLKVRSNIAVIFRPEDFGLNIFDSIYDKDSRELAKIAGKSGFVLDYYRSTPSNHKGDLSLFYKNMNIILELTQANSYQASYFKVGQCYVQKRLWPKAFHVLVCKNKFFSKECIPALKELGIKIIYTNFERDWEQEVIKQLMDSVK